MTERKKKISISRHAVMISSNHMQGRDLALAGGAERCHDSGNVLSDSEKVAVRRNRLGWTQPDLATRAGVGPNTVWRLENKLNVTPANRAAILAALEAGENERGLTSLGLDTGRQDRLGSAHPRQSLEIVRAPDPIRQGDAYQSDFPRGAADATAEARIRELERQLDAEKAAHAEMRGLAARLTDIIATRLENLETRIAQAGSRKRR